MGRGQGNERIELPCKFGTLVCEVVRNDEDYREFAIDLVRPDGRAYQVALVGTNEHDERSGDDMVHAFLWSGDDEGYAEEWNMNPDGDGYYADGER